MAMDIGTADYCDPNDRRRLRPIHRTPEADARWGGDDDRNSGQEALLASMYGVMDLAAKRFREAPTNREAMIHAGVLAECWGQIRLIIGGGE